VIALPEFQPQRLRVADTVAAVVARVDPRRRPEVRLDVPPDLEVVADAFETMVECLLENALKYGDPPVRVQAARRHDGVEVRVEDHGRGVAPQFVPHLFEPFSRSDRSRRTDGGAGLGLAICSLYARALGGALTYEPVRPHGACFRLVLPAPR
jgi:signal transduction histidine kinase